MRYALLPASVVLGALGVAASGGLLAGRGGLPVLLVLAPLGLAIPLLSLRYLGLGVALLPFVGAAVPFAIGTGTESRLVAALLFSGFLLAACLLRALILRDIRFVSTPLLLPTIAFILVWILAYLYSVALRDPRLRIWPTFDFVQLGGLSVAIVPAAILLLCINIGGNVRWTKIATWSFLAVGFAFILAYFAGAARFASLFIAADGLFTMWTVALAYSQALINRGLPRWLRIALFALACAWAYKATVLETWWFSGWLPTLVVLVIITLLWSRRAFAGLSLAIIVLFLFRWQQLFDIVWGQTIKKGDLTRLDIWQQTLDLVGQYPLLGTGPAGYAVYFQSLYAGSRFSMSTHNNYLDVLAETGIVGCLVFGILIITLIRVGWQARSRWQHGFEGAYAQGVFAGLIGLLVAMSQGDWFIPFVYNQTIAGYRYTVLSWVFLGLLASLVTIPQEKEMH